MMLLQRSLLPVSTPKNDDNSPKPRASQVKKGPTAPPRPDFFANLKARSSSVQKIAAGQPAGAAPESPADAVADKIELISLSAIEPNPDQPRQTATPEEDAELAADIKERGLLQPIIVRPVKGESGRYELVAGERRCRAARRAGLAQVPVIVRNYDDREARTVAAIENLQRKDLDPLDEARYFKFLADEYNLSNRQIAEGLHKSASYVDQRLRLLQNDRVKNTHVLDNSQTRVAEASPRQPAPEEKPWKFRPREWEKLRFTLNSARGGIRQVSKEQKKELKMTIRDLRADLEALEKELDA
jgi:ParB family chromosome partitioning protein